MEMQSMGRPNIVWTEEMIDILTTEYPITFNVVLAQKLGISISTVHRKARALGLVKAGNGRINYKTRETVEQLFASHSHRQIATAAGVSERTVRRICKSLNLRRDREDDSVMRSEVIRKICQSENRRILFGLEQNTDRLIGKDKERLKIVDELKKYGYIVIKGSRKVYYSSEMRRIVHLESYAEALGLRFEEWESE